MAWSGIWLRTPPVVCGFKVGDGAEELLVLVVHDVVVSSEKKLPSMLGEEQVLASPELLRLDDVVEMIAIFESRVSW